MRWVRFDHEGTGRYGYLQGADIQPVEGQPFGEYRPVGAPIPLAGARLLPPIEPRVFYAVGFNYLGHLAETNDLLERAQKVPAKPDVGYRSTSALIGPDDPIVIPAGSSGKVQYEGELVAIVGRRAKHLSEGDALSCVFGYTIGNDVSERTWQKIDRTIWRAKNADTFKPMGPWIETEVDLDALTTRVRLNGKQVSQFRTNSMLFGVARFLSEISQFVTLDCGDMIWMGAEAPSLDMQAGDVVEVEIDGIGTLRNPVIKAR